MATEQNMKAHAGKAKILHFATHGFFNSFNTDKSAIAAYQPKQTISDESIKNEQAAEDGMLFTDEVFGMWLNADLVVLSSCQGGLGRYVPGEGIMAITRAFLYAGANSMIYSLWKVSDKHTKDLMISFYLNVLAGKDYPEALQLAKIKLLNNNKDDALPRFWAGFVLNWKPE
jgi:CHAT domain-containing protein